MKVCVVNNFPPYSGVGRVTYDFWRELNKRKDITADLYCTHAMTQEEFTHKENEGVEFLHKFPYIGNEYLSRFHIYFLDKYKLPKGYDIYHYSNHMLSFMLGHQKNEVVTLFDVIQLKQQVNVDMGNKILSLAYDWFLKKSVKKTTLADAVINVSEYTRRESVELLNLENSKTHVVHCGINHNVFYPRNKNVCKKELNLPQDKKIVLHVGSEIDRKNLPRILEAFSMLDAGAIFVRVGDKTKNIEDVINKLGIKDKVIYRESHFEEEVAKYYSAADVHVFPSLEEGFGLPSLEAMACGCPNITSNIGAMAEIGGTGAILVNPYSVDEIYSAIKKVLNFSSEEKQVRIDKGLKRASVFTSKNYTDGVVKIYQGLLN